VEVKQLNLSQIKYRIFVLLFFLVLTAHLSNLSAQWESPPDGRAGTPSEQDSKSIVTGKISDAETGEMLENVNVFLSFTTIGTSTAEDGSFKLTNIPVGVFDLVISRVGYERHVITLQIVKTDSFHYEIKLKPQLLQTDEVAVIAESPEEWKKNLKKFEKAFIGETDNAKYCKILNPEVLNFNFDEKNDTLVASSDSILHIDNFALGYRIHLILAMFVWDVKKDAGYYLIYPHFEELQPRTLNERSEWQQNRENTYKGSLKHFLYTLNSGNTEAEKFIIFSGSLKNLARGFGHRVSPDEFQIAPLNGTHFKMLQFPGSLRIEYGRRDGEYTGGEKVWDEITKRWIDNPNFAQNIKSSIITLKKSFTLIDTLGNLFDPLAIEVTGDWAQKRIADLLPLY